MSDTETKPDPFRQTIEVAEGPNKDGDSHMVRTAHTLTVKPIGPPNDLIREGEQPTREG